MLEAISPFPQYAFMAWCSVKAQGQLYPSIYAQAPKVVHFLEVSRQKFSSAHIFYLIILFMSKFGRNSTAESITAGDIEYLKVEQIATGKSDTVLDT
jgi:hypothetical protein